MVKATSRVFWEAVFLSYDDSLKSIDSGEAFVVAYLIL